MELKFKQIAGVPLLNTIYTSISRKVNIKKGNRVY